MKKLKEVAENINTLSDELSQLELDVSNKEKRRGNLESDIKELQLKKDKLSGEVKNLGETVKEAVLIATGEELVRIGEVKGDLKTKNKKVDDERTQLAGERKDCKNKQDEYDRAIAKSNTSFQSLERERGEVKGIKNKLLSVIKIAKEALDE